MPSEEAELVARVIAGDPAAEEEFFRTFRPRLYRASMYFLGSNDGDADDVVQETFIIALPKLKDYVFNAPIYAWLRQICLRVCYARVRKRKRLLLSEEEDLELLMRRQIAEKLQRDDDDVAKAEQVKELNKLKARLSPESLQVVDLRSVHGMSYTLIARTLKIPIGTVMSRLSRARKQMKKMAEDGATNANANANADHGTINAL